MIHQMTFWLFGRPVEFAMDLDMTAHSDMCIAHCLHSQKTPPEPEVCDAMARIVREGDAVIDGGANVGFMTLVLSNLVGRTGKVLAFEPATNCLNRLEANLRLNSVENVDLCKQPLWDKCGERLPFYLHERNGENSLFEQDHIVAEIPTITTILDAHDIKPRLIKLDLEGAEYAALRGAQYMLRWKPRPYVIVELNRESLALAGKQQHDLRGLMRDCGYDTFVLEGAYPTYIPPQVDIVTARPNTNVLFSTIPDVAAAWKECRL